MYNSDDFQPTSILTEAAIEKYYDLTGINPSTNEILGQKIYSSLEELCRMCGMLFMIIIAATSFSYVFRILGGDYIILDFIEKAGIGSWGLLILLMVTTFVLGFFFDWLEIALIVLPVFTPLIGAMDFGDHVPQHQVSIWFLILICINLQTSFLTPPVGFAIFYLKGVAPAGISVATIYRGVVPFILLQLLGLGLIFVWPELVVWLPSQAYPPDATK